MRRRLWRRGQGSGIDLDVADAIEATSSEGLILAAEGLDIVARKVASTVAILEHEDGPVAAVALAVADAEAQVGAREDGCGGSRLPRVTRVALVPCGPALVERRRCEAVADHQIEQARRRWQS